MDGSEHDDAWWSREVPRMREGNRLEAKRAKGGLPHSLWETYSSFANTEGGLILLGVSEHEDHSLYITGVDDARNMAQDFWNMVHDPSKGQCRCAERQRRGVQPYLAGRCYFHRHSSCGEGLYSRVRGPESDDGLIPA